MKTKTLYWNQVHDCKHDGWVYLSKKKCIFKKALNDLRGFDNFFIGAYGIAWETQKENQHSRIYTKCILWFRLHHNIFSHIQLSIGAKYSLEQ